MMLRCANCRAKNYWSYAQLRHISAVAREQQKIQKANERAKQASEKDAKRLHAEARQAEVNAKNEELEHQVGELQQILAATLDVDDFVDFENLKETPRTSTFSPDTLSQEVPVPRLETYMPQEPTGLGKFLSGSRARYAQQVDEAKRRYEKAVEEHTAEEAASQRVLQAAREKHEASVREAEEAVAKQHAEIDGLKDRFVHGDPAAVTQYFTGVLEASTYPETFPRHTKMAFVPESRQLVVELQLPTVDVISPVKQFKYVKTKDEISEVPRPAAQVKALYSSLIAQMALRTVHEIFESDRERKTDSVVLNGFVESTDKRTGKTVTPYLVTLRTSRDAFDELDLAKVDALECLKGLHASVSKSPSELAPVRPVLEFSMVDSRFVEESDVLSGLDQRPNLMELTPSEFESLITNLFERMGLETRMTQASRDGGVDCVAFDQRPIFGGKVVIQAKRYKNTVGVSAVRDLFGTLQNEGASKGILVTTSGYGKAAFDFANGKPLELLDGGNLLYLLQEHTGIDAKIEPPEDWRDPVPDIP
jgi:restriction system protein